MKKSLFLALTLLLASCASSHGAKGSSIPASSSPKEELSSFAEEVNAVGGFPIAASVKMETSRSYLTDGSPMTITSLDSFRIARYVHEGTPNALLERKGTYQVGASSASSYVSQTYHDEKSFYLLTSYQDGEKVKQVADYDPAQEEATLNIAFAFTNQENILFLQSHLDDDRFLVKYDFGEEKIEKDGEYTFSYSITQYTASGSMIPAVCYGHEYTLIVSEGVISKSTDVFDYELYAGGVKGNWSKTTTETTYEPGEKYPSFAGDIFDPSQFTELS